MKRKPKYITRREFNRELQHLQRDLDHAYNEIAELRTELHHQDRQLILNLVRPQA